MSPNYRKRLMHFFWTHNSLVTGSTLEDLPKTKGWHLPAFFR